LHAVKLREIHPPASRQTQHFKKTYVKFSVFCKWQIKNSHIK
jgi:hypothetical protein